MAVLDTGIYPHRDFDRTRGRPFLIIFSTGSLPYDDNGHGTHVCGILAGSGAASQGRYRGIAPGCLPESVMKVLDRGRKRKRKKTYLKALDWIIRNRDEYGIRIVNISVGTTYGTFGAERCADPGGGTGLGQRPDRGSGRGKPRAGSRQRHIAREQQESDHRGIQ